MGLETDDHAVDADPSASVVQPRFKPLGSEALLGIAIAVAGSIVSAMWYSMHEQFSRMETRFIQINETINNNQSEQLRNLTKFLEESTKQRYDYHVETLSAIDEKILSYQQDVQLDLHRLETAVSVVEDVNRQRISKLDSELGLLSSVLLPAAGPE